MSPVVQVFGCRHDEAIHALRRPASEKRQGTKSREVGYRRCGGRNAEADFHGQKRSNDTHASTTDPDARLYRKGKRKETKLCFIGHGLMENCHGLLVDACLTLADAHAERVAALHMIEPRADRPTAITLGADKAYDAEDFVNELRSMNVTRMWRRIPATAALRSTGERPGTAAMPSASASASGSRRHSAGSKRRRAREGQLPRP